MRLDKPGCHLRIPSSSESALNWASTNSLMNQAGYSTSALQMPGACSVSGESLSTELAALSGSALKLIQHIGPASITRGLIRWIKQRPYLWGGLSHYSIGLSFNKTGFVNHRLR